MKRIILIVVSSLIVSSLIAQNEENIIKTNLFQKLVLDVGAAPLGMTTGNNLNLSSYNYTLGYQITNSFDLRINFDVFTLFGSHPYQNGDIDIHDRFVGLSLGTKFIAYKGKNDSFMENKSIAFVGKFGVSMFPEQYKIEYFLSDISARAYLGKVPYFGLGYSYHKGLFSTLYDFSNSFYINFGLDF